MKKENRLPEFWCVYNDDSQLYKDHVIKYLNDTYDVSLNGRARHYGYDGRCDFWHDIEGFSNNPTLLTLEQFIEMTTEPEFKWGDKVLVRDVDGEEWKQMVYVAINPKLDFKYIVVDSLLGHVYVAQQCKPLPIVPTIPEMTMEEVQEKLGYEFKLIK